VIKQNRTKKITSFLVMDIVKKARKYKDAIHFEVGQPDLNPSPNVKEALHKAVNDNNFFYTESLGLKELRVEIQQHYKDTYGVEVNKNNILITPGTSGAFLVAYSLTCDYNQQLGFSDPGYPCYKNISYLLNIKPNLLKVSKETNFQISPEQLENKKLDALQISNPSNPIGNIYNSEDLALLIKYCLKNNIDFISDELYHGLVYDEPISTALEFSQDVFVINGFSKYYCMPGFRVGWIIVPNKFIKKAEAIAQNIFISAPTLSQFSAIEAFDYTYLEKNKEIFKERRDYLYNELKNIFDIPIFPQGAFYIWVDISKYSDDSFIFAKDLFDKTKVAVTAGIDFGDNETHKYVRFAYTIDMESIKEGISRIKSFLNI